jgi:Zn-dependent metalloprotease
MYIGDGDGKMFTPLGQAIDIIAHEAGHAILESEIQMGFDGQEGALHESFGDVIGSLVDADDWQIGEDSFTPGRSGDSLRDMSRPEKYHHMDDLRGGSSEPHLLADIPNLAAVRVAEKIGREEMGKVWYEGFTTQLKDHAKFADAAIATVKAAEQLFGAGSAQASAVTDAWTSVGVLKNAA